MKKIYLLFVAATLAACSAEPLENEVTSGLDADLNAKISKVADQIVQNEFVVPDEICAGEDAHFLLNAEVGSNLQVQQLIGGEWIQVDQISKSTSNPHVTTLNFETAGEYMLRYKAGNGGYSAPYTVLVKNCGCDESFSYVNNWDGTYTFTYVPEEDVELAELVFTFPQAVTMSGLQGWTPNGDGNAQTFKTVMDLSACTSYSWTVALDAECNPSGKAILWTDFKVDEDSKKEKFERENILKYCN